MPALSKGTAATKYFYDHIGWQPQDGGRLGDWTLFLYPDTELQRGLDRQRKQRIRDLVAPGLEIVELACGANPGAFLAGGCRHYTAVDFSPAAFDEASRHLHATGAPFKTIEADITSLPFPDSSFDLAYSAQAIYHIDTADGQAAAFSEAMRVLRPGGRAIFIMGNPFPIMFPYRALRRMLAMTPGLNVILERLRPKPPLPYLPMPLGWMRRQLSQWGEVTITGYAMASVDFSRRVPEGGKIGSLIWSAIANIETRHQNLAARFGNYVTIIVDKHK